MDNQKNINKFVITLICGVPSSGKSTISSLIKQNFIQNCIYLDIDQIEYQLHEIFNQNGIKNIDDLTSQSDIEKQDKLSNDLLENILNQLERNNRLNQIQKTRQFSPQIWKISRNLGQKVVETLIDKATQSASLSMIIVEDVFNLRSQRKNYFHITQKHQTGFCEVLVKMKIEDVILNDSLRPEYKKVGQNVILKSEEQFDYDINNKFIRKIVPLHKDHFLLFENSNKIKLEESVQKLAQQMLDIGDKIVKQNNEISDQEYQLLIQQHKENIADQLNLQLNEKVNYIFKSSNYDIKNNGGGEGLSILKKLFFKIAKNYIQQPEFILKQNIIEELGGGKDDLLKKYKQKFKTKKNFKEFEEISLMIYQKISANLVSIQEEYEKQNILVDKILDNQKQGDTYKQKLIYFIAERTSATFLDVINEFYNY